MSLEMLFAGFLRSSERVLGSCVCESQSWLLRPWMMLARGELDEVLFVGVGFSGPVKRSFGEIVCFGDANRLASSMLLLEEFQMFGLASSECSLEPRNVGAFGGDAMYSPGERPPDWLEMGHSRGEYAGAREE